MNRLAFFCLSLSAVVGVASIAGEPRDSEYLADPTTVPEDIQLQIWTGQSSWQGAWNIVDAVVEKNGGKWIWQLAFKDLRQPTDKIRWIFPKSQHPISVRNLLAHTTSLYKTTDLRIEAAAKAVRGPIRIEIYNGVFLDSPGNQNALTRAWDGCEPLHIRVRYARTHQCKTDQTVLRFSDTSPPLAVGVEQLMENDAVYVPVAGLFVTRDPAPVSLAVYRQQIAGRGTVRQRVHELPDQTFERALEAVHQPIQDHGPMMVSLACDQRKFIAYRHGPVAFKADYEPSAVFDGTTKRTGRQYPWPYELHAVYGDGKYDRIDRHLDGGWLPLPVTRINEGGIIYRTRTFVTPIDDRPITGAPNWLRRRAVCVGEYTIENTLPNDAKATMTVSVLDDIERKHRMAVQTVDGGMIVQNSNCLLTFLDMSQAGPLDVHADGHCTTLSGMLRAIADTLDSRPRRALAFPLHFIKTHSMNW